MNQEQEELKCVDKEEVESELYVTEIKKGRK